MNFDKLHIYNIVQIKPCYTYIVLSCCFNDSHLFFNEPQQNKYKEKYTSDLKGHYEDSGYDKKTLHAMKASKLASDVSHDLLNTLKLHLQNDSSLSIFKNIFEV